MQTNNFTKEQISNMRIIIRFMTSNKVCHLRKPIHNNKNTIPPFLCTGNPKTKSIEISSQGTLGTGRGIYKPCGLRRDLAVLQVVQRATNLSTSRRIHGQNKCASRTSSVFLTPKCPINPPPCASCNNKRRTELSGMHSLLSRNTNTSLKTNLFQVLPSLQFCNTYLNSASCTYCSLIVSNPNILKSS